MATKLAFEVLEAKDPARLILQQTSFTHDMYGRRGIDENGNQRTIYSREHESLTIGGIAVSLFIEKSLRGLRATTVMNSVGKCARNAPRNMTTNPRYNRDTIARVEALVYSFDITPFEITRKYARGIKIDRMKHFTRGQFLFRMKFGNDVRLRAVAYWALSPAHIFCASFRTLLKAKVCTKLPLSLSLPETQELYREQLVIGHYALDLITGNWGKVGNIARGVVYFEKHPPALKMDCVYLGLSFFEALTCFHMRRPMDDSK